MAALSAGRLAFLAAALLAAGALSWVHPPAAAQATARAQPTAPAAKPRDDTAGTAWSSLTPAQRKSLAPLERDWSTIDAQRKAKWLEIATRFPSMPADEQRRMQERMTEWARMTPDERGRARLSFQEAKQLSPQERQARWEAYQALTPEDRQALAERAKPQAQPSKPGASTPMAAVPKQNVTSPPRAGTAVKPVAPTIVQVQPGATTTLITKTPTTPPQQRPGQAKIEAQPGQVNRTTMLPQRPAPGAAARVSTAASTPASQP
ncbi:DUF3106 domain-containing protein [Aquincola sp. S2]|uniref:DUF3106 domain-containing protein n=1 Tax=Pseudaquabacterium terrae TaxID=2732868 RepID=A0ABX2EJ63_9BURK|nr:DUF3106 domain-containing protein [Aquabacterium terrae]NRF68648.1 DUF3106 domain-containing protein [Aquabacterium terrae]